jgi:uncharacterized OB-fold protein
MCSTAAVTSGEATYTLELPYRRSLGPVISGFFTGLRDATVLGSRTAAGRVMVPPLEYDPETGDDVTELVPVGSAGVVRTWSWVVDPMRKHPLDHPFAWVLVQLDGADTALLHALDVSSMDDVTTGMRVQIRWSDERVGHINDIACFEIEGSS